VENKLLSTAIAMGLATDADKISALLELGTHLGRAQSAIAKANQIEHGRGERTPDSAPDEALEKAAKAIQCYLAKFSTHKSNVLGMSRAVDERLARNEHWAERDRQREIAAERGALAATPNENPLLQTAREMGLVK
jgi:hypothetical protein